MKVRAQCTVRVKSEERETKKREKEKKERGRKGSWFHLRYCLDIGEIWSSHNGVAEE